VMGIGQLPTTSMVRDFGFALGPAVIGAAALSKGARQTCTRRGGKHHARRGARWGRVPGPPPAPPLGAARSRCPESRGRCPCDPSGWPVSPRCRTGEGTSWLRVLRMSFSQVRLLLTGNVLVGHKGWDNAWAS
jgi:hypothetical protein